jgi:hypothetical protein
MADFKKRPVPFDEALTFTRGSEATYFDAAGVLRTAAVDEPRFTYDPETGEPLGLLIEEQRTNLAMHNSGTTPLDSWTTRELIVSTTTDTKFGDVIELTDTAVNDYHNVSFETPDDNLVYSRSVYVKKVDIRYVVVSQAMNPTVTANSSIFDLDEGTWAQEENGGNPHGIESIGDGWYRIDFYRNNSSASTNRFTIGLTSSASGGGANHQYVGAGSKLLIALPQVELGSLPSSPIKTEGTQVTRAADNCTRTLGAEFNASEGRLDVIANVPVGETVIQLGSESIVSDFDGEKDYTLIYSADPSATILEVLPSVSVGTIKSIRYEPNGGV